MVAIGRPTKYPWEKWFGEKSYTLRREKDFTCQSYVIAQQIRNRARKLGKTVQITISDNVVKVINHA